MLRSRQIISGRTMLAPTTCRRCWEGRAADARSCTPATTFPWGRRSGWWCAGQRADERAAGVATTGLVVGGFLAVATVSSCPHRAWIWRCTAAGLNQACWAFSRRRGRALTLGWATALAYGVGAGSYLLAIFAPSRTLEISFCWG